MHAQPHSHVSQPTSPPSPSGHHHHRCSDTTTNPTNPPPPQAPWLRPVCWCPPPPACMKVPPPAPQPPLHATAWVCRRWVCQEATRWRIVWLIWGQVPCCCHPGVSRVVWDPRGMGTRGGVCRWIRRPQLMVGSCCRLYFDGGLFEDPLAVGVQLFAAASVCSLTRVLSLTRVACISCDYHHHHHKLLLLANISLFLYTTKSLAV